MANKKNKILSLIFNRNYYKTKKQIKDWLSKHPEYHLIKFKREPILKLDDVYKVYQREPRYFKKSTLIKVNINKAGTIKKEIGKLK